MLQAVLLENKGENAPHLYELVGRHPVKGSSPVLVETNFLESIFLGLLLMTLQGNMAEKPIEAVMMIIDGSGPSAAFPTAFVGSLQELLSLYYGVVIRSKGKQQKTAGDSNLTSVSSYRILKTFAENITFFCPVTLLLTFSILCIMTELGLKAQCITQRPISEFHEQNSTENHL